MIFGYHKKAVLLTLCPTTLCTRPTRLLAPCGNGIEYILSKMFPNYLSVPHTKCNYVILELRFLILLFLTALHPSLRGLPLFPSTCSAPVINKSVYADYSEEQVLQTYTQVRSYFPSSTFKIFAKTFQIS